MPARVFVVATMDTKADEANFVADLIRAAGLDAVTVDVSASEEATYGKLALRADIARSEVLASAKLHVEQLSSDRGKAVGQLSAGLSEFLVAQFAANQFAGVIGLGGSGGTSLIAAALRRLPIGLPKLIVSTVASGDTSAYIDCTDLVLSPSVVDVAGLNAVSMDVLQNAAHAMVGMVQHRATVESVRPLLGLTMFGVTTPCVMRVKGELERRGWECLVFHAVGTGGRATERLVEPGRIVGVLDLTTTEVVDYLAGGIFPATEDRFEVYSRVNVPLVVSFGAMDMVNFGPRSTVPQRYAERLFHEHNAQITLMRTTAEENAAAAEFICARLNRAIGVVRVLIPEGGVSKLDVPGGPFWDTYADQKLFDTFRSQFHANANRKLITRAENINAPEFADAVVEQFLQIV